MSKNEDLTQGWAINRIVITVNAIRLTATMERTDKLAALALHKSY